MDDIFVWLLEHAEEDFNSDPTLLTVSGLSVGANLALAASLKTENKSGEFTVLGAVPFLCSGELVQFVCDAIVDDNSNLQTNKDIGRPPSSPREQA